MNMGQSYFILKYFDRCEHVGSLRETSACIKSPTARNCSWDSIKPFPVGIPNTHT